MLWPSLAVLSCLITVATACVPMKTPDPGIPATKPPVTAPPGPKCTDIKAATAAQCPVQCSSPLVTPTIGPQKVTCSSGVLCVLFDDGGTFKHSYSPISAYCTDKGWYDTKYNDAIEDPPTLTLLWACCPN